VVLLLFGYDPLIVHANNHIAPNSRAAIQHLQRHGLPRRDSSTSRGAGPFSMRVRVFSEDKTVLEERWSRAKLHTIANEALILVGTYQSDEIAIC